MFPVLFRIPVPAWDVPALGGWSPIPVYSYGVALALSLVVAWFALAREVRRASWSSSEASVAFVAAALSGLVTARLLYVALNPDEVRGLRDVLAFSRGGLSLYGAWWGGWLGAWWALRRAELSPWRFADAVAPTVALGLAMTRVGCYLYGSDFGRVLPASAPRWLASLGTFPRWSEAVLPPGGAGSPAWLEHVRHHGLPATASASLPVHPTQLYEAALGVVLFGLAWRLRPRFAGQRILVVAFVDACARFALETLRDDPDRGVFWLALSPRWGLTLGALALAAAWFGGFERVVPARWRMPSRVIAALVPVCLWASLGHLPAAETRWLASASQGLAVVTAGVLAVGYRRQCKLKAPAPKPESHADEPPDADRIDDPFVDAAPVKPRPKRAKKRKKRPKKKA